MVVYQADSPTWVIGIAKALEDYLLAAAALPPPDEQPVVPHQPTGWYAPTPGGPPSGRTPWIHLTAISIACFGETIVLSFRWKPDSSEGASTYLLPMTTVRADPTTGSDALITRLDFFLDTQWRERRVFTIGGETRLVSMPP